MKFDAEDVVVIAFAIIGMFSFGYMFWHLLNFMIVTGWVIPCF